MNDAKGGWLTVVIAVVLITLRIVIEPSESITLQCVAGINIVALNCVIWSIIYQVHKKLKVFVENQMTKKVYTLRFKKFKSMNVCLAVIMCVGAWIYLNWVYSGVYNDVISIIALCISIEDGYIENRIYCYYDKLDIKSKK